MRTKDELDLLKACKRSDFDEIGRLLEAGTNPQFRFIGYPTSSFEIYETPIGEIMRSLYSPKHVEAIKALLDAGVDVNAPTNHRNSGKHSTSLGKALLAHRDILTSPEIQLQVVDLLLSRGADVRLLLEAELEDLMEKGEPQLLVSLLNAGLNPNTTIVYGKKTLLEHAISASTDSGGDKQAEKAKLLINRGANLSVKDTKGLSLAQRANRPDIVLLLLEKDDGLLADMTLYDTVILKSALLVQKLISRGDNLDTLNQEGYTPLMNASRHGHAEAAFLLMEAGANLNVQNLNGQTALHLTLINAGSFNQKDCDYTDDRRLSIILELYSRGALPSLDNEGRTPLMCCRVFNYDYALIDFCIREFSRFEAHYYGFEAAAYSQELINAYRQEMGQLKGFAHLTSQKSHGHLFLEKLPHVPPIVETSTPEERVNQALKRLIVALKTNNVSAVSVIMKQFPEINVNQITDEKGHRPLSIVFNSAIMDRLPLLTLLLANQVDVNLPDNDEEKNTPLLVCTNGLHHYSAGIKCIQWLLAHGANPNQTNAQNQTPLHKVIGAFQNYDTNALDVIELLLLHGLNHEALFTSQSVIDIFEDTHKLRGDWAKNKLRTLFNRFQPQPSNLIDSALSFALSPKNRLLFAKALNNNVCININEGVLSLAALIDNLQTRRDLTYFAKNRLAFLNSLKQEQSCLEEESELSIEESNTIFKLIYTLYKADMGITNTLKDLSTGYEDTKKMHEAARKIQFWIREKKKKDSTFLETEKNISSAASFNLQ
ncbi:ankyrin repeat domain-containing protein [Legionella quinlivanii]|uniref:ankyrin repeat domain-containing protein n=1 Tax=Legionella quinlivanii TaxID=45073 RepID=UPI002243620C|nr:ankyrin repeat domain-containing protein [Legionella quinlivanii]MCW8452593.1 ankyrin repeat domain-containing protein [Legionella quinlivanii]